MKNMKESIQDESSSNSFLFHQEYRSIASLEARKGEKKALLYRKRAVDTGYVSC